MPAEGEPLYCGYCVRALDDESCPECESVWLDPLTEPEARIFQQAYDESAENDDIRWGNAWLTVEADRARRRGTDASL